MLTKQIPGTELLFLDLIAVIIKTNCPCFNGYETKPVLTILLLLFSHLFNNFEPYQIVEYRF